MHDARRDALRRAVADRREVIDGTRGGGAVVAGDVDGEPGAQACAVAREHVELGPHRREIRDLEQRIVVGRLAGRGVASGDGAVDGCRDRISLQALVRFDRRERVAGPHGVADVAADGADDAGEARMHGADAGGIGRDRAVEHELVADRAGPCRRGVDAGCACDIGRDRRAAFVRLVLEAMVAAGMARDDRDVERVRLFDDVGTAQEVVLRRELDAIDAAAEPRELDRQRDVRGCERSAVRGCPRVELGRHSGFEDRELEREVAVDEQPSAVRAALLFRGMLVGVLVRGRQRSHVASGRQR